jgi:hypothetical protein
MAMIYPVQLMSKVIFTQLIGHTRPETSVEGGGEHLDYCVYYTLDTQILKYIGMKPHYLLVFLVMRETLSTQAGIVLESTP